MLNQLVGGLQAQLEFDVLAVYIKLECVWMLMPFSVITGAMMKLTTEGKAKKYINNWDIFYAEK